MSLIVGVRFADSGKLHYFDPGELELAVGDRVLVEAPHGPELGEVVLEPSEVEDTNIVSLLKKIIRKADDQDSQIVERDVEREQEAFRLCEQRIRKRQLPMKLIDVEHALDGSKLIFYFAAEGRVDFRELVKDLASTFKTRIELRQIGVRDEAKKVGGLGPCGRAACCNSFLREFVPVSIKMAKEQNLSLSPTKISGLCGRLMCCLHYEQHHYHEMHKKLPRIGCWVETPNGEGEVIETDPLCGRVKVRVTLPDGSVELETRQYEEVGRKVRKDRHPRAEETAAADTAAEPDVHADGEAGAEHEPKESSASEKEQKKEHNKKRDVRRKPCAKESGEPDSPDAAAEKKQPQDNGRRPAPKRRNTHARSRHRSAQGHGEKPQQSGEQKPSS